MDCFPYSQQRAIHNIPLLVVMICFLPRIAMDLFYFNLFTIPMMVLTQRTVN